ncbi:MAG TPA: glycosyl transferase family 2 [Opitutaceae bacterium]|jgi:hypothetical protein|nr:glycosyl transferase family 2 [Opitutaceae bacterium]
MSQTSLARRLGLGRLAYFAYHLPAAKVGDSIRAGGPLVQWKTARGRRAMERAASGLPPPGTFPPGPPLTVHVLTGRRFWYQAVFCLWTLSRSARAEVAPVVVDDGSLTPTNFAALARLFPAARWVRPEEIRQRLDEALPAARFPTLRERRLAFPLLRKLTDVHAGLRGPRLLLDSDMLFFRRPGLLLDWLAAPDRPLRATDLTNAYGYPLELLGELAGRPVPEKVNTGITGFWSEELDWDRMEFWCRTLIERAGTHYFQEQALVALQLAGRDCLVAPITDYVTGPEPPEALECRAILHHYVAETKRWYFQHNWRRVLADA